MRSIERSPDVPADEVAVRSNNAEQPNYPRTYIEPIYSDGTPARVIQIHDAGT